MLAGVIRQGTEAVKEAPGAAEKVPQPLTQKAAKAPEKPAKAAKGKKQSAPKGKSAAVASKKKVALPEVPSPEPTGKIKWGDAGQRLWAVRRGHF